MKKISKLLHTSIFKTIKFNLHYFGLKGLFKPYAIIARGVKLNCLKGSISISRQCVGIIKIGFPCSNMTTNSAIDIKGNVIVHDSLWLARGSILECKENALLEIGRLIVTGNTKISCKQSIKIEDAIISWGGNIMDSDHHDIFQFGKCINKDKAIYIGKHCWIGMNCTILKGSIVPNGSVIAAGSTITKKLAIENCIYYNNEILKKDIEWM